MTAAEVSTEQDATCRPCRGTGSRLHGYAICPGPCRDCGGTGKTVAALLDEVASLLHEVYAPTGVLIVVSAPNAHLAGRRPCDLIRDRDAAGLVDLRNWLLACAEGNFA